MEILIAFLFAAGLAVYLYVSFRKGDSNTMDYDELVRPGGGELRVKGLTEIFSDGGKSVRETLAAIMGPTTKTYVPKSKPEKKPKDAKARFLKRYGFARSLPKKERKVRRARFDQAITSGDPGFIARCREVGLV